jgi:hypothetical protein
VVTGNTNQEEYAVGGQDRNKAHFLEMAGALAILDFCKNIIQYSTADKGWRDMIPEYLIY